MGLCAVKPNAQGRGGSPAHAGMFQQFVQNQVVQQIGARKKWLLVFCLVACVILNVFGCILTQSERPSASCETVGLLMHGSSVVILLMGLVFYFIALLNLAGSPAELEFALGGERELERHRRSMRRAKVLQDTGVWPPDENGP